MTGCRASGRLQARQGREFGQQSRLLCLLRYRLRYLSAMSGYRAWVPAQRIEQARQAVLSLKG